MRPALAAPVGLVLFAASALASGPGWLGTDAPGAPPGRAARVELTLLGSSAAWPIPRNPCHCPQCTQAGADPRLARTRTGILMRGVWDEVLFDASADVWGQLLRIGKAAPHHIVLSHAHADHMLGLEDAAHTGVGPRRLLGHSSTLAAAARTFPWLVKNTAALRPTPWAPRERRNLCGIYVTALPLDHSAGEGFQTYGFVFEAGARRLFLATDLQAVDPADHPAIARADAWVVDGSVLGSGYPSHLPMERILALRASLGGGPVVFTHLGHHGLPVDELKARLARSTQDPLWIALDGTRVVLDETQGLSVHGAR